MYTLETAHRAEYGLVSNDAVRELFVLHSAMEIDTCGVSGEAVAEFGYSAPKCRNLVSGGNLEH